jgi:hypothetical protein
MSDQEALIAFQLGEGLDQETTRRLWASGYLEVTNHDTCPQGGGRSQGKVDYTERLASARKITTSARWLEQLPW